MGGGTKKLKKKRRKVGGFWKMQNKKKVSRACKLKRKVNGKELVVEGNKIALAWFLAFKYYLCTQITGFQFANQKTLRFFDSENNGWILNI